MWNLSVKVESSESLGEKLIKTIIQYRFVLSVCSVIMVFGYCISPSMLYDVHSYLLGIKVISDNAGSILSISRLAFLLTAYFAIFNLFLLLAFKCVSWLKSQYPAVKLSIEKPQLIKLMRNTPTIIAIMIISFNILLVMQYNL